MLALALPLVLTQLTQILVHTTEVVLLAGWRRRPGGGHPGGGAVPYGMMFGIGVASATAPLIAQAKGARQPRQIRRIVRQGLWVTLAITLPLMARCGSCGRCWPPWARTRRCSPMTEGYMRAALWGLPFAVGFIVLRSFIAAFARTRACWWRRSSRPRAQHAAVVAADLRRHRPAALGHVRRRDRRSRSPSR